MPQEPDVHKMTDQEYIDYCKKKGFIASAPRSLKFASADEALQHLANITGKRVMVAAEESRLSDSVYETTDENREFPDKRLKALVDSWISSGQHSFFVTNPDPQYKKDLILIVFKPDASSAKKVLRSYLEKKNMNKADVDEIIGNGDMRHITEILDGYDDQLSSGI